MREKFSFTLGWTECAGKCSRDFGGGATVNVGIAPANGRR
jgi:hypothetical protein